MTSRWSRALAAEAAARHLRLKPQSAPSLQRQSFRRAATLVASLALAAAPLRAQCPDGTPPPCAGARPRATGDRAPSLAVLYLEAPDTADASVADGITEDLIARLSALEGVRLTSHYASLRYRGRHLVDPRVIGRELGVRYVLHGTLRRSEEQVRVVLELTDAARGFNAWGQSFDFLLRDVFALQDSITTRIALELHARLARPATRTMAAAPTVIPQAYEAYLRGRAAERARTPTAIARAIVEYRRATTLDDRFAAAWAGLAHAYVLAENWGADSLDIGADSFATLATQAAERAVRLDSTAASSWVAIGMASRELEPRTAVAASRRAIGLDSSDAETLHQMAIAWWAVPEIDSAIAAERRAIARDPYYAFPYASLAQLLNIAGRPLEALGTAAQGLVIDSTHAPLYWHLADAQLRLGRPVEARRSVERALALGFPAMQGRLLLALADLAAGDTATARRTIAALAAQTEEEFARHPSGLSWFRAGFLSGAYAQLGDVEAALTWGRRITRAQKHFYHFVLARHWFWGPVRSDERFQAFLANIRP